MWSNHEYHIHISKFLPRFQKQQKDYLVMTLSYHSRDTAQTKEKNRDREKKSIQIQGRELGVPVDHLRILKLLLKRLNTSSTEQPQKQEEMRFFGPHGHQTDLKQ
jgi:hypothetical protein